jgi:hypothetical protein
MANADNSLALVMGVADFKHEREGFMFSTDHLTRVELPRDLSEDDVQRMRRDFELLAEAIRDYPTEMRNLF